MVASVDLSARRTANEIILYLSPTQGAPPLPFELHGSIAPDVWALRVPIIAKTAGRYSKPLFERIWMVFGFIATLVIPMILHGVIYSSLRSNAGGDTLDVRMKSRGITGAIFLGMTLFFFLPIIVWKVFGRMQIKSLLKRWSDADHKNGLNSSAVSDWRVRTPGVFTNATVLIIKLPPNLAPSAFHPDAYLPSYINGAVDTEANYYYPYKHHEPGLPRMSVIGNVPLYADEKRGFSDLKV